MKRAGSLRIATRGSELALEQARRVQAGLPEAAEIVVVKTTGDIQRDVPLGQQQGVGFFTKEIEKALLSGRADLAVHSLKDLPVDLAPGLELAAVMERDEAADVLLVHPRVHRPGERLPLVAGARVGASSMRRQALLAAHRPDLELLPIRGNVPTRVRKCRERQVDALVLSRAGLVRLGIDPAPLLAYDLNPELWPGAAGQGVIAVECRAGDERVRRQAAVLDDPATRASTEAERDLLRAYGAGCHVPFGCRAWRDGAAAEWQLRVAAPGPEDRLLVARYRGADLNRLADEARAWLEQGCPEGAHTSPGSDEQWLVRPARW